MKIIHTSDWHIGKIVNEYSMIDDQKYILNKLIELIDEENADVLMIAGDVYDRSIPPVEAVELLNETLSSLVIDRNVYVLVISGNHDSGERLSFGSKILEKQGLYIAGSDEELYRKVVLCENNKNINFYLVPYKDPALTKKLLDNKEIRSHNDALIAVIDKIKEDLNENEVNILIGHGYVTMKREEAIDVSDHKYEAAELETSESERPLSIGGTDLIDGNIFKDFDYVALGHSHGRQKIGRETMRYSGSLLKYSFSEVKQKKSVAILDLKDKDIKVIKNNNSEFGISQSIKLGVSNSSNSVYMFIVCDQPYIKKETIDKFINQFTKSEKNLGCVSNNNVLLNPTIFTRKYKQKLLNLSGDKGGKKIILDNLDDLFTFEILDKKEVKDIDFKYQVEDK